MTDQIADREVPELIVMPRTHSMPLPVHDDCFAGLLWLTQCSVCVSTQRVAADATSNHTELAINDHQ